MNETEAKTHIGHLVTVVVRNPDAKSYRNRQRSINGHLDHVRRVGGSITSKAGREMRFSYEDVLEVICLTGGHEPAVPGIEEPTLEDVIACAIVGDDAEVTDEAVAIADRVVLYLRQAGYLPAEAGR